MFHGDTDIVSAFERALDMGSGMPAVYGLCLESTCCEGDLHIYGVEELSSQSPSEAIVRTVHMHLARVQFNLLDGLPA